MNSIHLAMFGLIAAYLVVWFLMPRFIPVLQKLKFGQAIRELGPQSHLKKAGTPTMGGLVIIFAVLVSALALSLIAGNVDWYTLAMMLTYGVIGFVDDYIKVSKKHNEGLTVKQKLALQIASSLIFTGWAYKSGAIGTGMYVPFMGMVDFGYFYLPITFIAIIAVTNAVNLSDGLDGLCVGVSSVVMVFFLAAALTLPEPGSAIYSGCFIGACVGFQRYNSNPADVFMGDTGSMALGGGLIAVAIRTHMEMYFLIAGFIFVMEAASVLIQVGYFKLTHGKRVFRMAPIHHHFELGGWKETRVVAVFTTWAVISVAVAFLLL